MHFTFKFDILHSQLWLRERTITEQVKQLGPTKIRQRFYLPDSHPFAKPTTIVKYIGYQYPSYESTSPSGHFQRCQQALDEFEVNIRATFPDATIKVDKLERENFKEGRIWDESKTNPLFEGIKGKLRTLVQLANLVPVLRPISERLSWVLLRELYGFTGNMNWMSGVQGDFNPKDERLLVFDQKDLGRIILSVTPYRYYRRFLGGVSLLIAEPGRWYLGTEPLPILIEVPHKQMADGTMPFERIIAIDSGPLSRVFPQDKVIQLS